MRQPGATALEYFRLARSLGGAGDDRGAIKLYLRALEHESEFPEALINLGVLYNLVGDSAEALACLRRAAEIAPRNARATYNLGVALAGNGLAEEAIVAFEATLRNSPRHRNALYALAVSWAKTGNRDRSTRYYEEYRATLNSTTKQASDPVGNYPRPVVKIRFVR